MLLYLVFRIISATTAFLYPGYASYKTLSQRPANEAELERWLMYWSVLGCIVAVEYVAEWLVSWLPLYYPLKTLFLLYLALPQTSGSAWLYQTQLRPFFSAHEHQIDTALASVKGHLYAYFQRLLRRGWEQLSGAAAQAPSAGPSLLEEDAAGAPAAGADAAGGPAQLVAGLWSTYGPGILAGGAMLLSKAQASAAQQPQAGAGAGAASSGRSSARKADGAAERRRQLEAELAALEREGGYDVGSAPGSPAVRGAFEEVEVPSDMEDAPAQQGQGARTSWFG